MISDSKSVLITGVGGYLGSRLFTKLKGKSVDVWGLERASSGVPRGENKIICYNGDPLSLIEIFEKVKPQLVIHLASSGNQALDIKNAKATCDANITLGVQILEAMRAVGAKNIIYTNTYWTLRPKEDFKNLYTVTKAFFGEILNFYQNNFSVNVVDAVITDVYGPDDSRPKFINQMIRSFWAGENFRTTPGEQYVNLIHIDDVVDGIIAAMELFRMEQKFFGSKKYAIAGNSYIKVKDLLTLFGNITEELYQRRPKISLGAINYRTDQFFDCPQIPQPIPNWTAKISIDQGLEGLLKGQACQ